MAKVQLPENYQQAERALAQLVKVDEVKDILDKGVAMQTYALQAKDDSLIRKASQARWLATNRLEELVEEARAAGRLAKGSQGTMAGKEAGTGSGKGKGKGKTKAKTKAKVSSGGPSGASPEEIVTVKGLPRNLLTQMRKLGKMSKPERKVYIDKQIAIAVAGVTGDRDVLKGAKVERDKEKKVKRAVREKKLATQIKALPKAKFGVIYADPEWKFEVWNEDTGSDRAADNHYTTSATDAIKSRDVPSIAADNCVLFLWATVPMLPQALEVMDGWGFEYKSHVTWNKDKIGTGYWFRNKHEILLLGTKGKVPAPAPGEQWASVIDAAVGKHSEKPAAFAEMIEEYFPNLPKIELNARGSAREGWTAWGAEAVAAGEPAEAAGEAAAPKAAKAKVKKKAATKATGAVPGIAPLGSFEARGITATAEPKRSHSKKKPPVEPGDLPASRAADLGFTKPGDLGHVVLDGVADPTKSPPETTHVELQDPPTRPEPMFDEVDDQTEGNDEQHEAAAE
jgi:N6-adenosine-specific RNA methylase IME4